MVPELSTSALTAVSLQMAATNVPAPVSGSVSEFYAACVARAYTLVPSCSLQQIADLCWAFFRAQVPLSDAFHIRVVQAAQTWTVVHMGDFKNAAEVSRESTHEAANFMFRLSKAKMLAYDDDICCKMLYIIASGVKQVHCIATLLLLRQVPCQSSLYARRS